MVSRSERITRRSYNFLNPRKCTAKRTVASEHRIRNLAITNPVLYRTPILSASRYF